MKKKVPEPAKSSCKSPWQREEPKTSKERVNERERKMVDSQREKAFPTTGVRSLANETRSVENGCKRNSGEPIGLE
jgi:hypothetical protein